MQTRSIVWDVDDTASPPTMTVLVIDRPFRYATVALGLLDLLAHTS